MAFILSEAASSEIGSLVAEGSKDFGDTLAELSICGAMGDSVGVGVAVAATVDCGLTAVVLVSGFSTERVLVAGGGVGTGAVGNLANRLAIAVGVEGVSWVKALPKVKTKLHVNPPTTKRITSSG